MTRNDYDELRRIIDDLDAPTENSRVRPMSVTICAIDDSIVRELLWIRDRLEEMVAVIDWENRESTGGETPISPRQSRDWMRRFCTDLLEGQSE